MNGRDAYSSFFSKTVQANAAYATISGGTHLFLGPPTIQSYTAASCDKARTE